MSSTRPPLNAANRLSYFHEASMEEYTPANSINEEESFGRGRRGRLRSWAAGEGKVVLRMVNAVLHLTLCSVLLANMVQFMVRYRGRRRRPQAIALTTIVAVDCCLDLYAMIRFKNKWQGWATAVRLLLAMGYIAQFLVYVGFRKVFPSRYAYWGMAEGYSEPVVYLLLLALGIWNLLHTAIHRHALGRDLRRYNVRIHARESRSSQVEDADHSERRRAPSAVRRPATNTAAQLEEGPNHNVAIALGEIHADDKGPGVLITNQIGTSVTSGESSTHGGSTIHTESETVTAETSRRTSAIVSDDEERDTDAPVDGSGSMKRSL